VSPLGGRSQSADRREADAAGRPLPPEPPLEGLFRRLFGDAEPTALGSGWTSGVLAVCLGIAALAAVLCLRFPALLTWPAARELYPLAAVRVAIDLMIAATFLLGLLSALLRRRKALGMGGMALGLAASLLGGGRVPPMPASAPIHLGLDWFLVNVLLLCVVFVPLERIVPHDPGQLVFRRGWTTDGVHFLLSHLLVQASTLMTLAPATVLMAWAVHPGLQAAVAQQPAWLQFAEIVVVADLAEYGIHRLFHRVSWLWPFHQVHHSSRQLDWLAGSRLHVVDVVLTRGFTFVPIFLLGFAAPPVYAYLVFVSLHAAFIHANVGLSFGWLESVLVLPRFHHWHHSAESAALDKNFAVHLPWLDRLFGTYHCPRGRWPREYGTIGPPVPETYPGQLLHPFRRRRREPRSGGPTP
jgi:lathosterol oxidase